MGIEVAIAAASLAFSAYSAIEQQDAQKDAARAQRKAGEEQKAIQAQQAAQERRQQIREERIKRARVIQASSNTGVSNSSGELGAVSGLSSQLGSNIGGNLGLISHASNISDLNQQAANSLGEANTWAAIGGLSRSIFSMSAPSLFKPTNQSLTDMWSQPPAPVETRQF